MKNKPKRLALKAVLIFAASAIVGVSAHAGTPQAKPKLDFAAAGTKCMQANQLATDKEGVVLSCKEGTWVADGAIWGSQWNREPMFLLNQALGDGIRTGRQCVSTLLSFEDSNGHSGSFSMGMFSKKREQSAKQLFGARSRLFEVLRLAEKAVDEANAHGKLVEPSALRNAAAGTEYILTVREAVCAERINNAVTSR